MVKLNGSDEKGRGIYANSGAFNSKYPGFDNANNKSYDNRKNLTPIKALDG